MKLVMVLALILGFCGIACAPHSAPALPTPLSGETKGHGEPTRLDSPAPAQEAIPNGWKTYLEPGEFRLSYPPDCALTQGPAAGTGLLDTPRVRITLPDAQFGSAKTNLVEAYLVVGVSSEPNAVSACSMFTDVEAQGEARKPKTVHGVEFASRSSSEGAAGNVYDGRVYRAASASRCYEVALIVRTGNMGNYEAGTVAKFEDERAFAVLERIFETLQLLP